MRNLLLSLFALFLTVAVVQAQSGLSSSSKKALKAYNDGLVCLQYDDSECTEEKMLKAVVIDPDFLEPRLVLAEFYRDKSRDEDAIVQYEAVLVRNKRFFLNAVYHLGELKFRKGELDEAEKLFAEFLEEANLGNSLRGKAQIGLDNCMFSRLAMKHPVPFQPVNLGKAINSPAPEYFPCITADNGTLMFTRLVENANRPGGGQEDFFESKYVDGVWQPAQLVQGVSTSSNEGAGTLSADGRYLIYTACDVNGAGDFGGGRKGYGSCDLFISIRVGDRWSKAQNLGSRVNSTNWESQPSLASDGRTLYYIKGGWTKDRRRIQDIFMSYLGDDGKWSKPKRLGKNVNTSFLEESVQIHPDGQTLYFTSNGHPGMGGLDIYLSRKQEDGTWGEAVNVGYPINTAEDENSVLISSDGALAFFGSDRSGGEGDLDLYAFNTHAEMRPAPVSFVRGRVFDKHTKKPLEADVALLDLATGERVAGSYSDPSSGEFLVCLPAGKDYALNVSADGYIFYSENYSIGDVTSFDKPFELLAPMSPLKSGAMIALRNVFFETASAALLPASTIELERLVALLNHKKELRIEVAGHTDNIGEETENMILSQQRADAVRDFAIEKGIDASRIESKGYGEEDPIESNDTETGRGLNRRTEVRVL